MSTPHVLLGLLAGGPRHGYDLKRAYDERLPQAKPLAYGQVYATLGRLERDGLVTPAAQDQDAGPERTWYALTDAGRARLDDWLRTVEPPGPYEPDVLFADEPTGALEGLTGEHVLGEILQEARASTWRCSWSPTRRGWRRTRTLLSTEVRQVDGDSVCPIAQAQCDANPVLFDFVVRHEVVLPVPIAWTGPLPARRCGAGRHDADGACRDSGVAVQHRPGRDAGGGSARRLSPRRPGRPGSRRR